jgi:hypothetical protein
MKVLGGDFGQREPMPDADIADEDVEAGEGSLDPLKGRSNRVGIGDVEGQRRRRASAPLDMLGSRLEPSGLSAIENHVCARDGEGFRDPEPESLPGTRHQGNPAAEVEQVALPDLAFWLI